MKNSLLTHEKETFHFHKQIKLALTKKLTGKKQSEFNVSKEKV
jgi:hypothetical protein